MKLPVAALLILPLTWIGLASPAGSASLPSGSIVPDSAAAAAAGSGPLIEIAPGAFG